MKAIDSIAGQRRDARSGASASITPSISRRLGAGIFIVRMQSGGVAMRLKALEVSRGIASLSVMIFHLNAIASWKNLIKIQFFQSFIHGVDFFFVISGFIIFYVHREDIGKQDRVYDFSVKRLVRLYPILWIVVIFSIFIETVSHRHVTYSQIFTSLLLIPSNLTPIPNVVWTLRHEVIFYIAFMALVFNKKFGIFVFSAWTLSVICQLILVIFGRPIGGLPAFFMSSYEVDFLLGIGVAWISPKIPNGYTSIIIALIVTSFAIFAGNRLGMNRTNLLDYTSVSATWWVVFLGMCFSFILIGVISIEKKVFISEKLEFLGKSSYALYLIHVPTMEIVIHLLAGKIPAWASMISAAIIAIAMAMALHLGFERPVTSWLRRKLLFRHDYSCKITNASPSDPQLSSALRG